MSLEGFRHDGERSPTAAVLIATRAGSDRRAVGHQPIDENAFDPLRARVKQICRSIEDRDDAVDSRCALKLVDLIEEFIRSSGWICGKRLGTEKALAQRLGVGLRAFRQAARILTNRGILEVRRGNAGGLFVSSIDRKGAIGALNAALGVRPDKAFLAREAAALLPAEMLAGSGPGATLVRVWLDQLANPAPVWEPPLRTAGETRAQRLAVAIVQKFGRREGGAAGKFRIGSLEDLCEHFSTGLPVMIQAIRVLEDQGIVASIRGRAGGIEYRGCGPCLAIRVVRDHISSHHARVDESDRLVRAITSAALKLAHARGRETGGREVFEEFAFMERCAAPTDLGLRWYSLQRALCDLGANPVLHLLARCFSSHVVLHRARSAEMSDETARTLVRASGTIVRNVKSGVDVGSLDAHLLCQNPVMQTW